MVMSKEEAKALATKVRDNLGRLKSCHCHLFLDFDQAGLGAKLRCEHCGGEMRISDVINYVRGYIAAGGNPEDVAQGWTAAWEDKA